MMNQVTFILSAIEQGDPRAAEQLLPLVYDELRKLAAQRLAQEKPGQTLQATALVHEAYLRLVGTATKSRAWNSRGHFFAAAAEAMRRILVDNARHKRAEIHGGGRGRVELAEGDWLSRATAGPGRRARRLARPARRGRCRLGRGRQAPPVCRHVRRGGGALPRDLPRYGLPALDLRPGLAAGRAARLECRDSPGADRVSNIISSRRETKPPAFTHCRTARAAGSDRTDGRDAESGENHLPRRRRELPAGAVGGLPRRGVRGRCRPPPPREAAARCPPGGR